MQTSAQQLAEPKPIILDVISRKSTRKKMAQRKYDTNATQPILLEVELQRVSKYKMLFLPVLNTKCFYSEPKLWAQYFCNGDHCMKNKGTTTYKGITNNKIIPDRNSGNY